MIADYHGGLALQCLEVFPPSPARSALELLVHFVLEPDQVCARGRVVLAGTGACVRSSPSSVFARV